MAILGLKSTLLIASILVQQAICAERKYYIIPPKKNTNYLDKFQNIYRHNWTKYFFKFLNVVTVEPLRYREY